MESLTKEIYTNIIDDKAKVMIGDAPITPSCTGQSIAVASSLI